MRKELLVPKDSVKLAEEEMREIEGGALTMVYGILGATLFLGINNGFYDTEK